MTYQVEFTKVAEDDLAKLDRELAQQTLNRLRWLADNAESVRHRALSGPWSGVFRLRIGDFRAIYSLERADRRIVVHFVRHRSEIYRLG